MSRVVFAAVLVAALAAETCAVHAQSAARKKLLFLTHAALYKHSSLAPAEKAVAELGAKGGFDVTTLQGYTQDSDTIDLSMISPRTSRSSTA